MSKFQHLFKKLKLSIEDEKLMGMAFVHRSYLNENREHKESNERLEFLGDSILSFLTSNFLYKKFPDVPEGELTNFRSAMVKTTTFAKLAESLGLGEYLLLSKGEEDGGGRKNPSILADTFEAFIGALYLTCGIKPVEMFLENHLFPLINEILSEKAYKDAKSNFQEVVQEVTRISPQYKVIKEIGPDHAKEFTVGVYVENTLFGTGTGKSKQEAETNAASVALEKWSRK